jgi:hypothetical protein
MLFLGIHDNGDMARPPSKGSSSAHGRGSPSAVGRSLIDGHGRYPQIIDIKDIARVLRPILGIRHRRSERFPDRIRGGFF